MAYQMHRLTQAKVDRTIKEIDKARKAEQAIKPRLAADGNGLISSSQN